MFAAKGRLVLVAVIMAVACGPEVRAGSTVIIGNYPQANDGTLTAVTSLDGTVAKAVGFTMSGQSYGLDSVMLRLMEQANSTSILTVQLYGGTTQPAGSPLVTFNSPVIPNVASDVKFTPLTPYTLLANTTYWIYVRGTSNDFNGIVWYASTPGIVPTGLATSAGSLLGSRALGVSGLSVSTVLNTFAVAGILGPAPSIPEPSSVISATTALVAGLAYAGWRRRRA